MIVGSIPVGLSVGVVAYALVRKAVASYQFARRARLAAIGELEL